MSLPFALIAGLTIVSAVAAMVLRNLIHCALALALTFAGIAAFFLQLDAQFVGFAQILVYIGAVAILIVFAILLTRSSEPVSRRIFSSSWVAGVGVAAVVASVLGGVVLTTRTLVSTLPPQPPATVRQIGDLLMTRYILPLEIIGLLLTAALIGAVVIALKEKGNE